MLWKQLTIYTALWFAYIVPFLFVLTIVVFFHELGHFYAARRCGVRVEVFSVGFGRAITSWHDKHGTEWKIGWLPLGGYVKFFGDENEASAPDAEKLKELPDDARGDTLFFKPFGSAIVVAAGPVANFILAIIIFARSIRCSASASRIRLSAQWLRTAPLSVPVCKLVI